LAAVFGICFFRFAMLILCGMLFLVLDEVAAVVRLRGNVADQRLGSPWYNILKALRLILRAKVGPTCIHRWLATYRTIQKCLSIPR